MIAWASISCCTGSLAEDVTSYLQFFSIILAQFLELDILKTISTVVTPVPWCHKCYCMFVKGNNSPKRFHLHFTNNYPCQLSGQCHQGPFSIVWVASKCLMLFHRHSQTWKYVSHSNLFCSTFCLHPLLYYIKVVLIVNCTEGSGCKFQQERKG